MSYKFQNIQNLRDNSYLSKIENLNIQQDKEIQQLQQIVNDQKNQIDNLSFELSQKIQAFDELNANYTNVNMEYTKLRQENSTFIDNVSTYENELNNTKIELEESKKEIERLNKVICVIEIDLNSSEECLKEKVDKIEQLTKELTTLQNETLNLNLKNKKLTEDNKNNKSIIEQYEIERKSLL